MYVIDLPPSCCAMFLDPGFSSLRGYAACTYTYSTRSTFLSGTPASTALSAIDTLQPMSNVGFPDFEFAMHEVTALGIIHSQHASLIVLLFPSFSLLFRERVPYPPHGTPFTIHGDSTEYTLRQEARLSALDVLRAVYRLPFSR